MCVIGLASHLERVYDIPPTGVLASPEMSGIERSDNVFSRMGMPTVQTGMETGLTRECLEHETVT